MFDFVRKEAKLRLRKTDTCNDKSRPCHSGIYRYPDWTRESGESHTWVFKVIFFSLAKPVETVCTFNCMPNQKVGNRERSIAFDWPYFCEFDFVPSCLAIELDRTIKFD